MEGVRAANCPRSGVTDLKPDCWALTAANWLAPGGFALVVAGLGVDQEKAGAAGDVTADPIPGEVTVCDDGMLSQLSIGFEGEADVVALPLTRRSKSSSVAPFVSSVDPARVPKDMKSSFGSEGPLD